MIQKIKKYAIIALAIFGVTAIFFAVYFYKQYSFLKNSPQAIAKKEIQQLVEEVGRLIVLPEGEEPTVATVSDPEKLKNQVFFINAKKGYKVLIYPNARKVILYDPAARKIVEVAPVNIGNPQAEAEPVNKTENTKSGE